MVEFAPYGHWTSPLAASEIARAKVSYSDLCSDGSTLYWLESRPAEGGRVVMVRADERGVADHSPEGVSIRSRVYEYGGGAMCLVAGRSPGAFAYVDQRDQRVWRCDGPTAAGRGGHRSEGISPPEPLSAPPEDGETHRHGGLVATADGDWVLGVKEVQRVAAPRPERMVVALSTPPGRQRETILLSGWQFYGAPRVDLEARRMAVVAWNAPDMSWDASVLVVVPLARRAVSEGGDDLLAEGSPWIVAGGPEESVGQAAWTREGALRFVSDRRGWWQPFVHPGVPGGEARPLTDDTAEWHGADWVLGQCTMAELPDGTLVARKTSSGRDSLVVLDPRLRSGTDAAAHTVDQPCVSIAAVCAHGEGIALVGSTPELPASVWVSAPGGSARALRSTPSGVLSRDDVSSAEPFSVSGRSGRRVHGMLHRPTGPRAAVRDGTRPPLLVWCHSGPTSACQSGYDPTVQFFTTRGFAVACVDYAGSTGYGRAYRCALWGGWGVADSEDCLDAALGLVARGDVDGDRMAARGSSAGGMTALNALAAGEGFAACATRYGVTDLLGLVSSTHDFEAHYTDRLVGPLPEARALYVERSPLTRAGQMRGSVLLLQGTEDPVVPPDQAERMRDALVAAGVTCTLQFFEGEGHGFRRAETLAACLEAELAFYRQALRL